MVRADDPVSIVQPLAIGAQNAARGTLVALPGRAHMTTEASYSPHAHHAVSDRTSALLPPLFLAPAAAFFTAALVLAPFLLHDALVHFYQPRLLAWTHMITLGWLSMAIIGVLYRYVPALVKRPLPAPRIALAQWLSFLLGVVGLIVHFWIGVWSGTAWAAGVLLLSALLLCVNMWPLLWHAPRRGAAEIGIFVATAFLVAAAALGTLLAINKTHPLLPGGLLGNLGAHAHVAAVGWVGVVVCALSFRFLPAFVLAALDASGAAQRLVVGLAAAVGGLAVGLLVRSPYSSVAALAVAAALLTYAGLVLRVIASHQLPLDWTAWHAVAGAAWCVLATLAGLAVAATGADSELGAGLSSAYAIAGLLGWFSNLLIGVSYKLFPAFVSGARSELGRPSVPIALLGVPEKLRPAIFVLYNAGMAMSVGGLTFGLASVLGVGTASLAVAGSVYGGWTLRTMAFVFIEPRPSSDPFAVLP